MALTRPWYCVVWLTGLLAHVKVMKASLTMLVTPVLLLLRRFKMQKSIMYNLQHQGLTQDIHQMTDCSVMYLQVPTVEGGVIL